MYRCSGLLEILIPSIHAYCEIDNDRPQGRIAVPAEVLKRLGVGPGSVLQWDEWGNEIVVRRAGRYSSEDVHRALFPSGPMTRSPGLKEAMRKYVRKKHARG